MTRSTLLLMFGLAGCTPAPSPPRIVLDGRMDDWTSLEPAGGPPSDSSAGSLGRLWVSHDEFSLLIRFETAAEISLQVGNRLEMCLDTDADPATGQSVHGLGAELCWRFGDRRGAFAGPDSLIEVEHQQLGLISAPTVTGTDFEVALARDAEPIPGHRLFTGEEVRILVRDGDTTGATVPAHPGGVLHRFSTAAPPPLPLIDIARHDAGHVRFLSYNLNNHLTDPARRDALARVLNAVDADVILLQEIRDTPTDEAVDYVTELLERNTDGWSTTKVGGESTVVLSSLPILRADSLGDSGGLLMQTGDSGEVLLLVALSLPCCDMQQQRSREADLLAAYVRDARTGAGAFRIPEGTPIVLMGDANFVGLERDRRVLTDGIIVDTATFGPGAAPDWDGTALEDLVPRHTNRPQTFTWHGEEFPPGRLDYLFYSDAVLEVGNNFVLYTPELPGDVLNAWGLEAGDTDVVTDHLPVVADLSLRPDPARTP